MKIAHLFDDPTVRAMLEAAERDEDDVTATAAREPAPHAIESLLLLLDEIDGDADFEDDPDDEGGGDDEPSLGSLGGGMAVCADFDQTGWTHGGSPDGEDEDGGDDELSGDESEPTLSATTALNQQYPIPPR